MNVTIRMLGATAALFDALARRAAEATVARHARRPRSTQPGDPEHPSPSAASDAPRQLELWSRER